MTAFVHHLGFEFKSGLRNSTSMLMYYLFPLGFYALMGLVMVEINPDFGELLIPSMVLVTLMAGTLLGLPGELVEAREAGIYRSFKVNGVPAISIIVIPLLATAFHGTIGSAVITLTAGPLFGVTVPSDWVSFVLVTLLSVFALGSLAALIGVVSTSARATVLWSQLVFLPSMLIGGLMLDLELLPATVRGFSGLLPSTYAMQAYRGLAYGAETILDPTMSVIVLAIGGVVALGLAVALFSWDRKNATRRLHPAVALLAIVPYLVGTLLA
jgi:ABC-2 type transport system permease protein